MLGFEIEILRRLGQRKGPYPKLIYSYFLLSWGSQFSPLDSSFLVCKTKGLEPFKVPFGLVVNKNHRLQAIRLSTIQLFCYDSNQFLFCAHNMLVDTQFAVVSIFSESIIMFQIFGNIDGGKETSRTLDKLENPAPSGKMAVISRHSFLSLMSA